MYRIPWFVVTLVEALAEAAIDHAEMLMAIADGSYFEDDQRASYFEEPLMVADCDGGEG